MSIARHHNEWLSLLELTGPFLSLPVLMRVFPQGLEEHDREVGRNLRIAYAEWEADGHEPAIHTAWLQFVLQTGLEYPDDHLLAGQALPPGLEVRVPEHGETLRPTWALKAPGEAQPRLLVSAYPKDQRLDRPLHGAAWKASPDTRMMTLLHGTGLPLGLVTNGEQWMLVAAQRGEATSFVSWFAPLWSEEPLTLRSFRALLDARRFFGVPAEETLTAMLAESLQNQQEVTDQLGFQVRKAVEVLIQALDRINIDQQGRLLEGVSEKVLYESSLAVMMRLVFLFSAEERGLLLLGDPLYDRHYAISTLRERLREAADSHGEEILERRHDAWSRLLATFRAIYGGVAHESLRLPAYGGSLFDPDRFPFLEGRLRGTSWRNAHASPLPVNNRTVLHLLEALQLLRVRVPGGPAETRRLSFSGLDIEQIGHVYEGLLDHTARRAAGVMLGLSGAKGSEREIALEALGAKQREGEEALVEFLHEQTGRSESTLRRALRQAEPPNSTLLQVACGNDAALTTRVAPFSHLLRDDTNGQPVVILRGSIYVTAGTDRRSTGTHYTQRSLTEPMVKTTLDSLLYTGFDQGQEPSPARLKPADEILKLKVCDPACGSGAFLVQACRYLSERLVEAWEIKEARANGKPLVIPEAGTAAGHPAEQLLPRDDEERLALARRLIAERCLYGVDVNPMAVEMAKLSLWLVTLHKHRPFTFLDHAIKCGDSLIGVHLPEQVATFHLRPERGRKRGGIFDYVTAHGKQLLERAREKREQLERFTVLDIRDAEFKGKLHGEAESALTEVRLLCDLIVGAGLATAGANEARSLTLLDARLDELALHVGDAFVPAQQLKAAEPDLSELRKLADPLLRMADGESSRRPFHWLVEFPEVFLHADNPGFDAMLGNPPFVGGQKITGLFGTDYRDFQVLYTAGGRRGSADLCAYFFVRAGQLIRASGNFGLLAVNTIAEGDTRQVGLESMLRSGHAIYAAWPNRPWPGAAAVVVSQVHIHRGKWHGVYRLNDEAVPTISAFLSSEDEWSPKPLAANAGKSFIGSYVLGMGFTMNEEQAQEFLARDQKNAEVLFLYLNGDDLNLHPAERSLRWIINFWDWPLDHSAEGSWETADEGRREEWLRDGRVPADYPGRVAADFPELLPIVERNVKPERQRRNDGGEYVLRRPLPERWWHYGEKRPALYHAIGRGHAFARHPKGWDSCCGPMQRVIGKALSGKHSSFAFLPNDIVFDQTIVVFAEQSPSFLAILSSGIHWEWAMKQGQKLKTDPRYIQSDAFLTFPLPRTDPNTTDALFEIGCEFDSVRQRAVTESRIGLTEIYNRIHDAGFSDQFIDQIRALLVRIDHALLAAYGWQDIVLGHGFHSVRYLPERDRIRYTISEQARLEILRRLSRLNRERYQDEQRQVEEERQGRAADHPARARRGKKPKLNVVQGGLF